MATANTKLTVDTSQAQQAIHGLSTAWVNASAKLNVVQGALNYVGGAMESVNQKIREQAQFFSATKDAMGLAAVQMSTAATDGMIKPMTLAKGVNVLMRGDLKLTQDQMGSVAKAAVELGRATGEDVNNVFDRLSKGVLKGSTEAISEYGITVANTGPIQQRQAAMLAEIEKRYSGISIAAGDAAEVQEKVANETQLQTMQAVKNLDGMAQMYSKLKGEAVEGFAAIGEIFTDAPLTKASQAAAQYQALIDQSMQTWGEVNKLAFALLDPEINLTKNAAKKLELQKQYAAKLSTQGQIENAIIGYASKYGFELNDIFARKERIESSTKRQADAEKEITKQTEKQNKELAEIARKKKEDDAITDAKVAAFVSIAADNLAREKAQKDAARAAAEAAARAEYELRKQRMIDQAALNQHNDDMILESLRKTEQYQSASIDGQVKMERQALADFYRIKLSDLTDFLQKRTAATAEAFRTEKALLDEAAEAWRRARGEGWNKDFQKVLAEDTRVEKDREAARVENVKNAELEIKEAKDKAAAEDKARLESIKAKTIEVSGVVLGAIFAEKKAREGLSRSEYVMKQLAVYMKGQALKYAAESLGYAAQAFAAQFINPPAAAAMWTASATAAAAASAFGLGAAGASKMAGKPSGGGSKSESSKAPSRETMTGTSVQRSEITVILGGRGVVIGNADEIARQIGTIMGDAQRRGVVRG